MTTPSNETLDYKIEAMEKQNAKEHKDLWWKIDNIENKLDTIINNMEKRFASKWVERIVKWLVWIILSWVAIGGLNMILNNI